MLASKTGLLLIEANSEEEEGNNLRELLLRAPWETAYTAYIGKACSWSQLRQEMDRLQDLMLDNVARSRGIFLAESMKNVRPSSFGNGRMGRPDGKRQGERGAALLLGMASGGKQNGGLTRISLQLFQHDIEQVLYTALQDSGIQAHQFLYKGNMLNERLEAVNTVLEMENWLRKILSSAALLLREAGESESVVARVKQYVRSSVGKDISRKDVADRMYLNPDYLDRVFKRKPACQ